MMQLFVSRCAGSLMEEKENYFYLALSQYPSRSWLYTFTRIIEYLVAADRNTSLQVIDGNKVMEVRLSGIDKGMTALKLVNNLIPILFCALATILPTRICSRHLKGKGYTIKIGNGAPLRRNYNIAHNMKYFRFSINFT